MSLPFSLRESVARARARVDALPAALDRLSIEAEDLSECRAGFASDGEALLARVSQQEEIDVTARTQLQGEYGMLASRLEEHVNRFVDAGLSFSSSMLRASTVADSGCALGRSSLLFIRAEAVGQTLRRMQEGPAWNNIQIKA